MLLTKVRTPVSVRKFFVRKFLPAQRYSQNFLTYDKIANSCVNIWTIWAVVRQKIFLRIRELTWKVVQLFHRLRGSASPVLTATGFVNGKGQFSTPHRIDTPQPITNIFVTGDYLGDPYGCAKLGAYPSIRGFWAHGWNITKIIFIYAPFLMNSPTGQTRRRIFTHDGSNDADSRKDVPFLHCSQFRGSKTHKTPNFGAWIGVFKPNSRNRKTCIFSKLLHRSQPNFAQW